MTAQSSSYTAAPPHLAGSVRAPRILFPFVVRTRFALGALRGRAAGVLV